MTLGGVERPPNGRDTTTALLPAGPRGRWPVSTLRVLLANDPLSYREALVEVIRALKPLADVRAVEGVVLEEELRGFAPQLVVCSRLIPAVEAGVATWVELYPGHGALSRICLCGELRTIADMQLDDLLSLVVETERLLRADRTSPAPEPEEIIRVLRRR